MYHLFKPLIALGATFLLAGCATESYVNDKTTAVTARTQSEFLRMDTQFKSLEASLESKTNSLDSKTNSLDNRLGKNESNTGVAHKLAQDALDRANAAHQLATGKLLYTVTLTDGQIRFASGQATLSKQGEQMLNDLAQKLKTENRNVFIEIQGHTDKVGNIESNKQLGLKRAEAVRDFLYRAGLPLHRMNVISYGSSQPEMPGHDRKSHALNRRVVLLVLQ